MIQISEDLVLGARFTLDKSGPTLLRIFQVSGLLPGVDTLAQAAVAQNASGGLFIPRYGMPHPTVPGLFVAHIESEPVRNSRTAAYVRVKYTPPEKASVPNVVRIIISGGNRAKLISQDPTDGSLFNVKYTDPSGIVLQEFLQVPALSPNTILQFIRQEPKSPLALSKQFRRTINSGPWQGGAARTWLCRAIDAASLSNLARYEVRYVFEYDPDGWDRFEYYVDPFTGKVPDDVQLSPKNDHGIAKVRPYATTDFSQLKLPNAF